MQKPDCPVVRGCSLPRVLGGSARERALEGPASGPSSRFALGFLSLALASLASAFVPLPALAESSLRLPSLGDTHEIAVTTFDPGGKAVGKSRYWIDRLAGGRQKLSVELGTDSGARSVSQVTFGPVAKSASGATAELRMLEERSQTTRADGQRLDLLVIDHTAGRARCVPDSGGEPKARHVSLPDPDRVVNVPMQLLFDPLVKGTVDEVRFQIVLCSEGPKLQDMIAVRGPRLTRGNREVLEIRYGPDFGKTVAFIASRLLPSFSFWFDAKSGEYLGHRMPLHTKGPEIVLIRTGLSPTDVGLR